MLRKIALCLFIALSIASTQTHAQLAFGVSPGIGLNCGYVGYQINSKIMPFASFQYVNVKFKVEQWEIMEDWYGIESYYSKFFLSASISIPTIGLKYSVIQKNKLNSFVLLNLSKPFLTGDIESDDDYPSDFKEDIKNLNIWGGECAFGTEYLFDENFSIGGEFGLRYFYIDYQESETEDYYYQYDRNINMKISPTFSRVTLNYYFK